MVVSKLDELLLLSCAGSLGLFSFALKASKPISKSKNSNVFAALGLGVASSLSKNRMKQMHNL